MKALDTPAIVSLLRDHFANQAHESFVILCFGWSKHATYIREVASGNTRWVNVDISDLFYQAHEYQAHAIIVAHNHPSGDPAPSVEDCVITEKLIAAGRLGRCPVLDHLIIAGDRFYSFKEHSDGSRTAHR